MTVPSSRSSMENLCRYGSDEPSAVHNSGISVLARLL
jgi:hypothetical protein